MNTKAKLLIRVLFLWCASGFISVMAGNSTFKMLNVKATVIDKINEAAGVTAKTLQSTARSINVEAARINDSAAAALNIASVMKTRVNEITHYANSIDAIRNAVVAADKSVAEKADKEVKAMNSYVATAKEDLRQANEAAKNVNGAIELVKSINISENSTKDQMNNSIQTLKNASWTLIFASNSLNKIVGSANNNPVENKINASLNNMNKLAMDVISKAYKEGLTAIDNVDNALWNADERSNDVRAAVKRGDVQRTIDAINTVKISIENAKRDATEAVQKIESAFNIIKSLEAAGNKLPNETLEMLKKAKSKADKALIDANNRVIPADILNAASEANNVANAKKAADAKAALVAKENEWAAKKAAHEKAKVESNLAAEAAANAALELAKSNKALETAKAITNKTQAAVDANQSITEIEAAAAGARAAIQEAEVAAKAAAMLAASATDHATKAAPNARAAADAIAAAGAATLAKENVKKVTEVASIAIDMVQKAKVKADEVQKKAVSTILEKPGGMGSMMSFFGCGPSKKYDSKAEAEKRPDAERIDAAIARARAEAEARAKAEAAARAKAEADAKAKAKAETEARAKAEAEARAKAEAEARAKAEAEARAKAEAEARAKAESEARAKAEAEAKTKAETEARTRVEPQVKLGQVFEARELPQELQPYVKSVEIQWRIARGGVGLIPTSFSVVLLDGSTREFLVDLLSPYFSIINGVIDTAADNPSQLPGVMPYIQGILTPRLAYPAIQIRSVNQ